MLLLFLGIRTLRTNRKDFKASREARGLIGSYFSTVLLGLTNPVTVFAFLAVFAAFGLGQSQGIISAYVPVLGVFAGSCLWFLALGYIAKSFRKKLASGGLRRVNTFAGIAILLSAVGAFVSMI